MSLEWQFPLNSTEARERKGFSILIPINRNDAGPIVALNALLGGEEYTQGTATGTSVVSSSFEVFSVQTGSCIGTSTAVSTITAIGTFTGNAAGSSIISASFAATSSLTGSCTGTSQATCIIETLTPVINLDIIGTPYIAPRIPGPLREYHILYPSGLVDGPWTYYEAETKARVSTREAARIGIGDIVAYLVVYVGTRQGDPTDYISREARARYVAGRKVAGGELATYNLNKDIPG